MSASNRNLELALRIRTAVQGAESVEDLRRDMVGLADEIEQTGQGAQEAGRQFDELDESERKAGETAKETKGPMEELKGVLAGIVTLSAAKEILDLNDRLIGLRRGFETVIGSSQGADQALEFVNKTADRLGTNTLDLAQAFLKVTASAKGTQLEGPPTEKIFSSIAGAMSTVNASGEELERVMDAVGQMMGKGVVSAEELRGQLGDSLPGAVQQAAQALMVSNAELSKMLESGDVIASEFLPKFATQLEKSMGGGGKQVEGFNASWNRLVNQFVEIATGPAGQGFTAFISYLTDKVSVFSRGIGFATDNIGALGRLLGGLAAGEASAAFKDFGQNVEDASIHLLGMKTAAEQATENQRQMAAEVAALTPSINAFQDAVARDDIKALPESLQAAIAEIKKTGDVATATEQAIADFMAAPEKNINQDGIIKLATSLQAVGKEAKGSGEQITEGLIKQLDQLTDEKLAKLKEQAEAAMASASAGSETARRAFADLGAVVEAVAKVQLKRAAEEADRVADAARDNTDALEQLIDTQREGMQTEIALARAKGQTWVAQQKSAALAKLEVQWAELLAAAKQAEIAAEQASLQAKIAVMQAAGLKTEEDKKEYAALQLKLAALNLEAQFLQRNAELRGVLAGGLNNQNQGLQQNTQVTQQNTVATQQNTESTDKSSKSKGGLGGVIASLIDYWREETAALSESTKALFELNAGLSKVDPQFANELVGGISEEADKAAKKIGDLTAFIRQMDKQMLFSTGSVGRYMDMIQRSGAAAERSYYEQKLAAEQLEQQIKQIGETGGTAYGSANAALEFLNSTAKITQQSLWLLNEQDMEQLSSEIEKANDKLREMQDEADAAQARLLELDARLARARGDDAAADRIDQQKQQMQELTELEQQLADARAEQNQTKIRQLEQELALLKQVQDAEKARLEKDLKSRKDTSSTSTAPTSPSGGSGGSTAPSGGGGTINYINNNNFYTDPTQLASEEWYRQKVLPIQDKINRLRK